MDKGHKTRLLEFHTQAGVPHLLCRIKDSVYCVNVQSVNEIVPLPELKRVAERTRYLIGVLDLRGRVVPVMNLELRFGRKSDRYSVNDYLLVLECRNELLAIIVNHVLGVERVDQQQLESVSSRQPKAGVEATCMDKIVKIDDEIVMLLDVDRLFTSSDSGAMEEQSDVVEEEPHSFVAAAPPDEQAVFRRRAEQLRQSSAGEEKTQFMPLAIAEISGEFVAFELAFVREFFEASQITPVPCCPRQILGNVNLRGNVLTVIDVRGPLNLSPLVGKPAGKIIVVTTDELTVGVLVDELHGVHYLPVTELANVPSGALSVASAPVKGTAPFGNEMMSVLDLGKLLALENWVVDEEVAH